MILFIIFIKENGMVVVGANRGSIIVTFIIAFTFLIVLIKRIHSESSSDII